MNTRGVLYIGALLLCSLSLVQSVSATNYYVSTTGNDSNAGTLGAPFLTLNKGISVLVPGDTLYIRAGTYRLMDQGGGVRKDWPTATALTPVTIMSYPGETAVIYGSWNTANLTWEQYNGTIWRLPGDEFSKPIAGLHDSGRRVEHAMQFRSGVRWHGNISQLVVNSWTVADASGIACQYVGGDTNNNSGCYIYYYPPGAENPSTQNNFEVTQTYFWYSVGSNNVNIKNIDFEYSRTQAIWCENCGNVVFQGNVVNHVSNTDDNAYGIWLDYGYGARVRNNTFNDSRYWGHTPGYIGADPNSRLISFMDYNWTDPPIVEYNNVSNAPGPAIGDKSGVANAIIRYNTIQDSGYAIRPDGSRCDWENTSCAKGDQWYFYPGGWQIYGNVLINNTIGIELVSGGATSDPTYNDSIYNNIFINNSVGINIPANNTGSTPPTGNVIENNIFLNNGKALSLYGGSTGNTIDITNVLPLFSSDYNLFFNNTADYFLKPDWGGSSWSGTIYPVGQIQTTYNRELYSVAGNPLFTNYVTYALQASSPARNIGDGLFWNSTTTDSGIYANPRNITASCPAPNGNTCWWVDANASTWGDGSYAHPYNSFEKVAGYWNGPNYVQGLIKGGDYLYVNGTFLASQNNETNHKTSIALARGNQCGTPANPTVISGWPGLANAVFDGEYLVDDLIDVHALTNASQCNGIVLQNIEVKRDNGRGIIIGAYVTYADVNNIYVHDGVGDSNLGTGGGILFTMETSVHNFTLRNSRFDNNKVSYGGANDNNVGGVSMLSEMGALSGSTIQIYNNTISNEIYGIRQKHSGNIHMEAYNNNISNSTGGFYDRALSDDIHNNLIWNTGTAVVSETENQGGNRVEWIHSNTVYNTSLMLRATTDANYTRIVHLYDNIYQNPGATSKVLSLGEWTNESVSLVGWTANNNLYYFTPANNIFMSRGNMTYLNFTAGQALLSDTTSRYLDSMLVNPPANFSVQQGSPAIGTSSTGGTIGAYGAANVTSQHPGDLNDDGKVDLADFRIMLGQFRRRGLAITNARADVNSDGEVNLLDFVLTAKDWGKTYS